MYALGNPGASPSAWILSTGQARGVPHQQRWTSDLREGKKPVEREATVIECKSPLSPGDSGGPVANDGGELIAVTTGDARSPNLLIDVEEVKKFLARYYESKRPRVKRPPPSQIAPARPPQP